MEASAGIQWDTLILRCTHYPLVKECLYKIWADKELVDPADFILDKLKEVLENQKNRKAVL